MKNAKDGLFSVVDRLGVEENVAKGFFFIFVFVNTLSHVGLSLNKMKLQHNVKSHPTELTPAVFLLSLFRLDYLHLNEGCWNIV